MEPFCESCRKFTGPLGPPNLEFLGLKLQIPRLKWDNPQDQTMEGHIIDNPQGKMMITLIVDDICMNLTYYSLSFTILPVIIIIILHHYHHHTSSLSSSTEHCRNKATRIPTDTFFASKIMKSHFQFNQTILGMKNCITLTDTSMLSFIHDV
jgi:hypothetical protein